jgi:hypothetical protein
LFHGRLRESPFRFGASAFYNNVQPIINLSYYCKYFYCVFPAGYRRDKHRLLFTPCPKNADLPPPMHEHCKSVVSADPRIRERWLTAPLSFLLSH